MSLLSFSAGGLRLIASPSCLPENDGMYIEHSQLTDQFDLASADGTSCFIAAGLTTAEWPSLVVEQSYSPSGHGFEPGVLWCDRESTLFVGAGVRLLAYRMLPIPVRLWEDTADTGFWGWQKHDSVVVMSAELELAAWSESGTKLWSTFVEPPWSYSVSDNVVTLDVMGANRVFPIAVGPPRAA